MDEIEVRQVIEKGKLPFKVVDILAMIFYLTLAVVFLYIAIFQYNQIIDLHPPLFVYFLYSFFLVLLLLEFWQIFAIKKLIVYSSDLALTKKQALLDKLIQEQEVDLVVKENCFIKYNEKSTSRYLLSRYVVIILYSEDGYYVNAVNNGGRAFWFSKARANKTIDRIKELETKM